MSPAGNTLAAEMLPCLGVIPPPAQGAAPRGTLCVFVALTPAAPPGGWAQGLSPDRPRPPAGLGRCLSEQPRPHGRGAHLRGAEAEGGGVPHGRPGRPVPHPHAAAGEPPPASHSPFAEPPPMLRWHHAAWHPLSCAPGASRHEHGALGVRWRLAPGSVAARPPVSTPTMEECHVVEVAFGWSRPGGGLSTEPGDLVGDLPARTRTLEPPPPVWTGFPSTRPMGLKRTLSCGHSTHLPAPPPVSLGSPAQGARSHAAALSSWGGARATAPTGGAGSPGSGRST